METRLSSILVGVIQGVLVAPQRSYWRCSLDRRRRRTQSRVPHIGQSGGHQANRGMELRIRGRNRKWNRQTAVGLLTTPSGLEPKFADTRSLQRTPLIGGENRGIRSLEPKLENGEWRVIENWHRRDISLNMASAIVNGDSLFGKSHFRQGQFSGLILKLATSSGVDRHAWVNTLRSRRPSTTKLSSSSKTTPPWRSSTPIVNHTNQLFLTKSPKAPLGPPPFY